MAKAPVVTELPLQNVRFLFGTMVDLRMLPQVLEQTGRAEIGEFKLVAHFPADEKAANNEAGYLARHKGFRGGDYNTYHGDPYTLDEIIWDATGRAGVHLVTKTKYGQVVEFPTIPDKQDSSELMLIVSEYVESIKTPPLIVRCSGIGGSISPLGNKKYQLNLTTGATKCPTSIKDHVPKKYHAEDTTIIPHVGGSHIMNAEDLSPAERALVANTIVNQMQGYYRTGVIGTDPVIGAFPNGPMSIAKRTPEAKQSHFREPAVQDEDGFWNKGPNRWQAHKIARGVAYDQLEKAREVGALMPGYRHRGRSGKFRRNPFKFGAEMHNDLSQFGGLAGVIAGELATTGEVIPLMHISNNSYNFLVNNVLPDGVVYDGKDGGTEDPMLTRTCAHVWDMYDGLYSRVWFNPSGGNSLAYIAYGNNPLAWDNQRMNPDTSVLNAEDFAAEKKLMCAEHDDYFQACGCTVKNASGGAYIGGGSLMDIHKDTGLDAFTPGELATSSAIHGDFDQASLNYSGHQNLEVRTAEFAAVSTASPNLNRDKSNLRDKIRADIDPNFDYNQCTWGPYALRMEGANTNKYYITLVYHDGKGVYRALGGYAGLGQNARLQDIMTTRNQAAAEAAAGRKLKAKERKGYFTYKSEDIPVWNDGIVEWETSGPMSPSGSGYSSASVPPTGVIAGPGDTFLNYTDAQNYLVESSGGLWGAEEFEAPMARIDPKNANDVANVKRAIKQRYKGIKIDRTEYITNRRGSSNKYHVFAFTNRGIFNGYGRIGKTMTIFGPMSESEGMRKLNRKLRQGYKEQV